MRRTARTKILTALLAPALLVALAACGGKDSSAEPKADDSSSSAPTEESPSAPEDSATAEESQSEDAGGDGLTEAEFRDLVGEGSTFETVHMTMKGKADGKAFAADMDLNIADLKHPEMLMTMHTGGQTIEMILVDDAMYMGQPGSSDPYLQLPYDPSSLPVDIGQGQSSLVDGILGDEKLTKIVLVGDETVNGVDTRHFTLYAKGQKPMQLWLDQDARPAQMVIVQDGSKITMGFSDFDEPVDIKAPKNVQEMAQ